MKFHKSRFSNKRRLLQTTGFSLIELAVGIAIIGLLVGSLAVPLRSQVESRKLADTKKTLDNAREALLGYAAAYGYFPCPANDSSNGAEAAGSSHGSLGATPPATYTPGSCPASVTGTNSVYAGYLPAVTLGFTPIDASGYAVDAWGGTGTQNRIRYAVSGQTVGLATRAFVSIPYPVVGGMKGAGMLAILNFNPSLLSVCSTAAGSDSTLCRQLPPPPTTITSNAIVVIWSLGPNAATTGSPAQASADEAENIEAFTSADRVFVMRDPSTKIGSEFDDIVTWISNPVLFGKMLAAGQLP